MSRCARCNGHGYNHETADMVNPGEVPDKVRSSGVPRAGRRCALHRVVAILPPFSPRRLPRLQVLAAIRDYWRCRRCHKLFWFVRVP